eukprot:CAMPEP_0182568708 /NCGR_PEP_ID=MMETSP1324-20130603/9560_1 /TAXON_ID=236786 /ORGANISM="Florenciella sp., Strain RCC1587" /LENGTH=253 /DNA_ID=CAMNT_0024782881 /DNA_START=52 /DNA_END=811 /DNA_ORIENTATION=-
MRWLLPLLLSSSMGEGLLVDLARRETRCLAEDMAEDALGKFTFHVVPEGDMSADESKKPAQVTVTVKSPENKQLHTKVLSHDVDTFSFTSHTVGHHEICFKNLANVARRVHLEVQTDLSVKDYSEVVRAEHLRPLELLFRRAEDKLSDISAEMEKSRDREAALRDNSEAIAAANPMVQHHEHFRAPGHLRMANGLPQIILQEQEAALRALVRAAAGARGAWALQMGIGAGRISGLCLVVAFNGSVVAFGGSGI